MFARTERLLLRPGWNDDAEALTHAIANEKIVRNLAAVPWPYDVEDARSYLNMVQSGAQSTQLPDFLIFARTQRNPELVGGIGLHTNPLNPFGPPELGYWIAESHWGHGYATEAGRAVIALARDSLKCRRIAAGYFTDNPASGAVLRKLGFKSTGKIVTRHSKGRGGEASMALVSAELGDDGCGEAAMPPPKAMRPAMERWAA